MAWKSLSILLGSCLGFFLLISFWKESDISEIKELSILTKEEKKNLELLFEHFFFFDQFAYPLFGSKPMSIGRLFETERFEKGWAAWKKISPLFQSEKFILDDYTFEGKSFVLIANLELVEKTYFENESIFNQTVETIDDLKLCLKARNDQFQKLMHNDLVLGVLLGYGKRNAQIFSNKEMTFIKPFTSGHPIFYYFSKIAPPYFACDPRSEETFELKKRYRKERAKIVQMAKENSLLVQMLVLFSRGGSMHFDKHLRSRSLKGADDNISTFAKTHPRPVWKRMENETGFLE